MSIATPDLIKSAPSPLRIGLVNSRFTVVLYLLIVGCQFLVNFVINGIVYLSGSDVTKNVEQSATNSAFVTGIFLFIWGILCATVDLRASALSGGSRTALTVASYVHSIVIIGLGTLIWWLLIAIHPLLFVMGRQSLPLGVDSFFSHGWRAMEPGASLVDFPAVLGGPGSESLPSWVRFHWVSVALVCRSCGWSSPSSTSPATCPRCPRPPTCLALSP